MTTRATIGFLAGLALIALGIAAVPLSADAQSPTVGRGGCQLAEVALDEGYGLTRKALMTVCRD